MFIKTFKIARNNHFECKEIIVFTLQIFIRIVLLKPYNQFNMSLNSYANSYKSIELYDSGPYIGHPELIIFA